MITSMTGFGSATYEDAQLSIVAEVKSLNSKFFEMSVRLPKNFSTEKELFLRQQIADKLERGKINFVLDVQFKNNQPKLQLNAPIAKFYVQAIQQFAAEMQLPPTDLLRVVMQMPDVWQQDLQGGASPDESTEQHWTLMLQTCTQALEKCRQFRQDEGKQLLGHFVQYIENIRNLLVLVAQEDPARMELVRQRLQNHLKEINQQEKFDANRFEQEMIYYLEKLDFTEEKVRLLSHLDYFVETLYQADTNGKKLNFIAQEIGREINTLGAKANHAVIQRLVVQMKDELEKIKEQINNVL